MWIVSTCPVDVSILRPRLDRSVRHVDGIEMARELRGAHGPVLTPGRYVGAEEIEDDGVAFGEKMAGLSAELYERMPACRSLSLSAAQAGAGRAEAWELDAAIRQNLEVLGYGE